MKKIIIYGSHYGTTKRYAEALSQKTGVPAVAYTDIGELASYDRILYFGGLYAGGVLGLAKTVKQFLIKSTQTLILVTVGLADPHIQTNTDSIKRSISSQIPAELYSASKLFHLRGGIDYQALDFKHKVMMTLLYNKVKHLPPERQTAETTAFVETYNQTVDFVDLNTLEDVIAAF